MCLGPRGIKPDCPKPLQLDLFHLVQTFESMHLWVAVKTTHSKSLLVLEHHPITSQNSTICISCQAHDVEEGQQQLQLLHVQLPSNGAQGGAWFMLMIELIVLNGIRFIRESNTSPLALKRGVWILCRLRFRCRRTTCERGAIGSTR